MISLVNASLPTVDTATQRDIAVLSSLAQLGWLTTEQVHALCSQGTMVSTVRTSLRYFREAGWVHAARWRIRGCGGSQLWAITAKGQDLVARYLPVAVPYQLLDLGRPSTALEHAEYRLQLLLRSFIVQLILEARQTACLAQLDVALHQPAILAYASCQRTITPDASLSVVWHSPVMQSATWLPWLTRAIDAEWTIYYPIYLARTVHRDCLTQIIDTCKTPTAGRRSIPTLILHHEEQLAVAQQALQVLSHQHPVRLSTWERLETGITREAWLDGHGRACSLQLQAERAS